MSVCRLAPAGAAPIKPTARNLTAAGSTRPIADVTRGFNWQIGKTVVGFESDLDWSNIRGSTDGANGRNGPCGGNPSSCETELQAFGTTGVRLGYTFDRWLPFVTGGIEAKNRRSMDRQARISLCPPRQRRRLH